MPSIQVYNWKLFFKDHDYVVLGSCLESSAKNGIPKISLVRHCLIAIIIIIVTVVTNLCECNRTQNETH